jgi:ABC-2 type transport system permease protein
VIQDFAQSARPAFNALKAIYLRELAAYFLTPLAYVFIAIFLIAVGAFTFEIGRFFETNQADLSPFFLFHPWLWLVFLPAIAMRLWADEARGGTLELLLSLPAPTWSLVLGKFLAAWTVAGAALAMTAPMWISVNWLGAPDNAAIALGYLMSFLMAGGYLAIACAVSAAAGSQVVAFVISVAIGFLFTAAGLPIVGSALGPGLADMLAAFSLLTHFEAAQRGVLELRSILFYVGFIGVWLSLNAIWVSARKGG